jgi:hypothetical protein
MEIIVILDDHCDEPHSTLVNFVQLPAELKLGACTHYTASCAPQMSLQPQ